MKKTINVTKRDIEKWVNIINSRTAHITCIDCAVAKAARRIFPRAEMCLSLWLDYPMVTTSVQVPSEITNYIHIMDAGHLVKPFKFTVEVPDDRL